VSRRVTGRWENADAGHDLLFAVDEVKAVLDWQFFQADALGRAFAGTLEKLVRCHSALGAFASAIDCARRWLALDLLDEAAHCQLMQLYAWTGQRPAALHQYRECAKVLKSQLGALPSETTTALYTAIAENRLPAPPRDAGLQQPAEPIPERAQLKGERRRATIVFAGVNGSTALGEQIDVEAWVEIVSRAFHLLRSESRRFGGEVDQHQDSLVALFGAKAAHEDDPERAVRAALAMQEAVRRYATELAKQEGIELFLRVGVNTGDVIAHTIGRHQYGEDTAMGHAIALAARIERSATPGTVLVSEHTYRLVQSLFKWEAR
jgi:class 3 adenylate cyclase